ncbi:MAG: hypothetical protein ABSA13_11020 [Beijerinckiaceae bacterium]|jgi:hypothetical protein
MMLVARQADDRKTFLLVRTALAAALVLSVTPRFASAEVLDPLRGYALDGTPVAQQKHRDGENVKPGGESKEPPRSRPAYVSYRTIRRIAGDNGFKTTGQPHRNGHSFIVNADDGKGHHFRLIFNAFNGQLVERTDLGPDASQVKTATNNGSGPYSAPTWDEVSGKSPSVKAAATVAAPPAAAVAATPPVPAPSKTGTTTASNSSGPYSAPTWDEVSGKSPSETAAAPAAAPVAVTPPVSTPAGPPASYAAVSPCEMTPAAAASKQAGAEPAQPSKAETTTASNSSGPYSAPTWDEVSGKDSSGTAAAPEADAAPGSPRITGSIPLGAPNKNSPPEPYWAPTWDEVSGQDAPPQTGEKP